MQSKQRASKINQCAVSSCDCRSGLVPVTGAGGKIYFLCKLHYAIDQALVADLAKTMKRFEK